jgi:hypothetical protein
MFILAQSRVYYSGLQVRPVAGWHPIEQNSWQWTTKTFSVDVVLPLERHVSRFTLAAIIPQQLELSCSIGERQIGRATYGQPGQNEFRCELPLFALHEPVLRLDFSVRNSYVLPGEDKRELGICIPLLDEASSETNRIPFRIE